MKVQATLKDRISGYSRVYEYDLEDKYAEGVNAIWEEGNYSCDCNRSLFLWNWDEDKAMDCNNGENRIELISLILTRDI